MVRVLVRIRVGHVYTRALRVVRTPVENLPVALYFITSVGNHRNQLIHKRYGQEFTVFTKDYRFIINTRAVANRDDFIVGKLDHIILFVRNDNLLRSHTGSALAIVSGEGSDNGTPVADGVEQGVIIRMNNSFFTQIRF